MKMFTFSFKRVTVFENIFFVQLFSFKYRIVRGWKKIPVCNILCINLDFIEFKFVKRAAKRCKSFERTTS